MLPLVRSCSFLLVLVCACCLDRFPRARCALLGSWPELLYVELGLGSGLPGLLVHPRSRSCLDRFLHARCGLPGSWPGMPWLSRAPVWLARHFAFVGSFWGCFVYGVSVPLRVGCCLVLNVTEGHQNKNCEYIAGLVAKWSGQRHW